MKVNKSFKKKYEELTAKHEALISAVKGYTRAFCSTRSVDSSILPAYGQPGQPEDKSKSSPNVFFVKDLITQVMSAKTLGFETVLYTDGGILTVGFRERTPDIPLALRVL